MKPHPKLRKTIKWGGAVVTLLLVGVWFTSAFGHWQYTFAGGRILGLSHGWFGYSHLPPGDTISRRGYYSPAYAEPIVLNLSFKRSAYGWLVPLWLPCLIAAACTATAWYLDRVCRRRELAPHLCPKCNYDRTGLANGAKCPECGVGGAGPGGV